MSKLRIVEIVVAVFILILVALPFLINVNAFRPKLESELTTALGRPVKIGNLGLSILSGSVSADDLSIADDPSFSQSPFIRAKSLKVGVEVMPLIFSKALHVTAITLDRPEINLLHTASGNWNFSSVGSKSKTTPKSQEPSGSAVPPNLSVHKLKIADGRLSVAKVHSSQKPQVYDKVNIEVTDFSFTSQFPFTMTADLPGGGDVKLNGKAGPINSSDAAMTPLEAQVKVHQLNLADSGFVDPASGIAGLADFDGTLTSDGKLAHSSGTLTADKLKLAQKGTPAVRTVQVKYGVEHDLQSQSGKLTQGDVNIGKAVAHLVGSYHPQGDSTVVNMKLVGQAMPVDELVAMLPALGVVLPSGAALKGGSLSTDLAINGPVEKLVTTGPIRLADTKLSGFDLGSKMSAVSAVTGGKTGADTTIQNFSSTVQVAPNGIQAQAISLVVPSLGEISGNGTISPSNALDFKMNAKLGGGIGQMAGLTGGSGLPFLIQGTTSNPTFMPDVKGMVGTKLKGLGGFPGTAGGKSPADALTGLFGKKKPK
jgi:AsmA protein